MKNLSIVLLVFSCIGALADVVLTKQGRKIVFPYTLNSQNIDFKKNMKFSESSGQFQVYIPKEFFPVKAPKCKKLIVLRMPMPENREPTQVAKNKSLFDEILKLKDNIKKEIPIQVDVAPYGKVVNENPLSVHLNECNVFFAE